MKKILPFETVIDVAYLLKKISEAGLTEKDYPNIKIEAYTEYDGDEGNFCVYLDE